MSATSKTSLSDIEAYRETCLRAATIEIVFENFRRDPVYCWVVEGCKPDEGSEELAYILQHDPSLLGHVETFRSNDSVGGPVLVDYPVIGPFAPTTVRYMRCLGDLIRLFGSLDGLEIAEIGVGYGGQCRIISSVSRPAAYTLVDLDEALLLAGRYLSKYNSENLEFLPLDLLPLVHKYDLVISNYGLSEVVRPIQDAYVERIVAQSKRGYIIWNVNPEPDSQLGQMRTTSGERSYRDAREFVAYLNARSVPARIWDHPQPIADLRQGSQVIVWGDGPRG
jgi:hypothetical protein